jgi:aspartyl-tRNA(Asn)/glutamyl-tRNA(Gln) amidotransferase subunit A
VIAGKTATMEFAVGAPDPGKPFPLPRNPWDLERYTGGSSSGSANGVAAGLMLAGSAPTPAARSAVRRRPAASPG